MSGCVDKVELILLPVFGFVLHPHRVGFDSYTPLPFKIHVIEDLILHFLSADSTCQFQKTVGEGGFAVVNMGNNTEISYKICCHFKSREQS